MDITCLEVTPFFTNCYILRQGSSALVIDPGDVTDEMLDLLKDCDSVSIVNTHGHCDHCGGNERLVREMEASLALHADDLSLLRSLPQQGAMFGVSFPSSPDPDRLIKDGDQVSLSNDLVFTVRHTPGHSPGHIVLITDGYVFCGDVLFAGSVGRTDIPGGDYAVLMNSIQNVLMQLPDTTRVYPGHGPATTIGEERTINPFIAGRQY